MMHDCLFCRIANHEIHSYALAEDQHTYAFLDIARDAYGHILIIPKKHVESILDCDHETLQHVTHMVKRIADHCTFCGFTGVNLLNASGKSAGQSVPHFHIHLLPRKSDDGIDAWPSLPGTEASLEDMQERLRITAK